MCDPLLLLFRPTSLLMGMNRFLMSLEITFRRDSQNYRPRINKMHSVKVITGGSIGGGWDGISIISTSVVAKSNCIQACTEAAVLKPKTSHCRDLRLIGFMSRQMTRQMIYLTGQKAILLGICPTAGCYFQLCLIRTSGNPLYNCTAKLRKRLYRVKNESSGP